MSRLSKGTIVASGETKSGKVDAAGHALAGIWVDTVTGTFCRILHAPDAPSEPADAEFGMQTDADGNESAKAVFHPDANSGLIYIEFEPSKVKKLNWIQFEFSTAQGAQITILHDWINYR